MDHELRLLERRAALGDLTALGALQRAHRRCGRGWSGERLHPRMVLGSRDPLYLYDPGKGHRIEMVWVPPKGEERGLWMSRGVVTLKLFVTFCRATGAPLPDRGPDIFTLDQARAYARWAGVTLPARHELDRAGRSAQRAIFSPLPAPDEHWQRERWTRSDRASFRVVLRASPAAGPGGRLPLTRAGPR